MVLQSVAPAKKSLFSAAPLAGRYKICYERAGSMRRVKGQRYPCRRGEQLMFRGDVPETVRAAFGGRVEA